MQKNNIDANIVYIPQKSTCERIFHVLAALTQDEWAMGEALVLSQDMVCACCASPRGKRFRP